MNRIFSSSNKVWEWFVVSSSNPQVVSMTVKGILVGVIPWLMQFLPAVGINLSPDFSNLPNTAYAIVYGGLSAISALLVFVGGVRKLWNTFFPNSLV